MRWSRNPTTRSVPKCRPGTEPGIRITSSVFSGQHQNRTRTRMFRLIRELQKHSRLGVREASSSRWRSRPCLRIFSVSEPRRAIGSERVRDLSVWRIWRITPTRLSLQTDAMSQGQKGSIVRPRQLKKGLREKWQLPVGTAAHYYPAVYSQLRRHPSSQVPDVETDSP